MWVDQKYRSKKCHVLTYYLNGPLFHFQIIINLIILSFFSDLPNGSEWPPIDTFEAPYRQPVFDPDSPSGVNFINVLSTAFALVEILKA